MEINEFINVLQLTVDSLYPNLRITCYRDRAQANIVVGDIHVGNCFAIHKQEFEDNKSKGWEMNLIHARVKKMLYELRDKINEDIKEIENATTKRT